ncbi:hybrid sensor histidine kinase/response regulator [Alteromonas oceanisediminis]|uniref:hybrid sensor histidine kinase/response regulator n=1 Tax=Alteromonas oceanisediminis TaxID=2836180 RepID=UPI001BD982AF|nr:PAS domain-containing hybrid sensor histidine kinase/response regulator [Alteromonas oceanisediminis]MBT0588164.1 PAS-domain containing protein [Alteromonas oceanisediminis]
MTLGWSALALIYLFSLFWIARWGDKNSPTARWLTSHPGVYSLAIAIYCTAWTFFGAVGQSSLDTWMYLPILLGPILVYTLGYRLIYKLVLVSKKQHINSIADFIASRYGKRQTVALLVTIIALLATIPYIALQLTAVGATFQMLTAHKDPNVIIVVVTICIAFFAIFFGTKRTDVTEYRRGLMLAISFESTIKLIALLLVGIVAFSMVESEPLLPALVNPQAFSAFSSFNFWAQTLMAAAAIICLPRQFHVAIVDNVNIDHLKTARWLFPLYLLLMVCVIPIIAVAGNQIFAGVDIAPDTYVLSIAMLSDSTLLQAIVFLGGLSAATAMIIVATLTLSTMLTNDVVLPSIFSEQNQHDKQRDYGKRIRLIRRVTIGVILLLALGYQQQMTDSRSLSSIGLIAFSLVIQLLPSIVGGLYWKRGHAHGVYAGLLVGLVGWILWLVLPALGEGFDPTRQDALLSKGAMISLGANALAYVVFSLLGHARLIDRIQAEAFVSPTDAPNNSSKAQVVDIRVEDLMTLLTTFMGEGRCAQLVEDFNQQNDTQTALNERPTPSFLAFCERALGGVIGASSARALIDSMTRGKKLDFTQVINFFDDTTQAMQFNMTALITSLENIDQGISVVDKQLRLVAWNKRYADLYTYPDGMLEVGTPVSTLVRYNAENGEWGDGDTDAEVEKRMAHLRSGSPHKFTRQRRDGRVIEMVGNPLPGGGFVTTFNDITGHIEIQQALAESNLDLEARVLKRTEEVHAINAELIRARKAAEEANASKTRFLALASHDVLQPLNAAKLYVSALNESSLPDDTRTVVNKLSQSVNASEALIATLLDIARLDQGELKPSMEPVSVQALLTPLIDQTILRAKQKHLQFSHKIQPCWVMADHTFLFRIMQNLLSNAVKYTKKGKVLLTVRQQKGCAVMSVFDTGVGISEQQQALVFADFYRTGDNDESGVGLGLGVVRRLSEQLHCSVSVTSVPQKGSCFSLRLPLAEPTAETATKFIRSPSSFSGLRILCVDDQQENLDALAVLLERWGVLVFTARDELQATSLALAHKPQIVLMDYQLGKDTDGLCLIDQLRSTLDIVFPACLITAVHDPDVMAQCKAQGVHFMNKPVRPAKLRALLQAMTRYIDDAGVID